MAQVRNIRPGYTVIHPNRDKASCKLTRLLVVVVLLASVALMLVLTIGGWSKLQGLKPVNFVWCLIYIAAAVFIWRWARGLLPIAAAFAILLLIVAAIAGTGLAGTSWSDRNHPGYVNAQSLLGGAGLGTSTLSALTLLLIPLEALLIIVAMIGFAQGWNVELEVPEDEARKRGSTSVASGPQAQTA